MISLTYQKILPIIVLVFCLMPGLTKAQAVYEGQVLNATNEAPLENATVTLLKAKLATRTDNQGYYRLAINQAIADDTLQFSFVGYNTYLLPVANYRPKMFIPLTPANNKLNQVNVAGNKLKTVVLDKFNVADIKDTRRETMRGMNIIVTDGYFTGTYYTTGTFAKLFEAPQANVKLNAVDLGRRDLHIPYSLEDFPLATSSKYTRFIIHIMLPDGVTGQPGKTIYTQEVNLTDNALKVTIDLKDKQIIIPTTNFFVAIEWLTIPINEIIKLNVGNKVYQTRKDGSQKSEETASYSIWYQPFMVIFASGVGTRGWELVDKKSWVMRDFRSPHPSPAHPHHNMALSATIVY